MLIMSAEYTTKEVIKSMKVGLINTPEDMTEFWKNTCKNLKAYGVPEGITATILGQCTNGTLEATIKTLELNNVQID